MRRANHSDLQLTNRELQILELIAHGFSAKEVAQTIDIAPRTVEGHIDTIRLKMQARNRAHMVAKAVTAGLVDLNVPRAVPMSDARPLDDFSFHGDDGIGAVRRPRLQLISSGCSDQA